MFQSSCAIKSYCLEVPYTYRMDNSADKSEPLMTVLIFNIYAQFAWFQ